MKTSFACDNADLILSGTCIVPRILRNNVEDNQRTDGVIHNDLYPWGLLYWQAVKEPLHSGLGLSNNLNVKSLKRSRNEPRYEKTGLRGFRPGPTQTGLCNHRRWLEV